MPHRYVNERGQLLERRTVLSPARDLKGGDELKFACPSHSMRRAGGLVLFSATATTEKLRVQTSWEGKGEWRWGRVMRVAYWAGEYIPLGETPVVKLRVGKRPGVYDREFKHGLEADHGVAARALELPIAFDSLYVCIEQE